MVAKIEWHPGRAISAMMLVHRNQALEFVRPAEAGDGEYLVKRLQDAARDARVQSCIQTPKARTRSTGRSALSCVVSWSAGN